MENLYRKVNTKARHVYHHFGGNAKNSRNTKTGMSTKMKKDVNRGLDYTPLFRFLLSKIGQNFDQVYSQAVKRLDVDDPIFWMVDAKREYFKMDKAIYPTLIVDENGNLQQTNPNLTNTDFAPSCDCCTHTFNGKVLIRKYLNKCPTR
jgi:hypothetical protein